MKPKRIVVYCPLLPRIMYWRLELVDDNLKKSCFFKSDMSEVPESIQKNNYKFLLDNPLRHKELFYYED